MIGLTQKRAALGVGVLIAAYLIYPYYALYRLGDAIRRGDASSLEALVDWDQVREGIKEDICDNVFDVPASQAEASNDQKALPPFGFSFLRGIAGSAIDKSVTPLGLVVAAHAANADGESLSVTGDSRANPSIAWAFFESPTTFRLDLLPPAEGASADPIRIEMRLSGGRWKVTRAWLPSAMLTQTGSRT